MSRYYINHHDFNPLHHEGGDPACSRHRLRTAYFNPLHHEGGDHFRSRFSIMFLYFNPLHHEGGDQEDGLIYFGVDISIHSTTRVETFLIPLVELPQSDFNPLHHEGGDDKGRYRETVYQDFNPLHHEGGDIGYGFRSISLSNFNPLHHEGGDYGYHAPLFLAVISIHSTTRVETAILHNNHYYSSTHFHKQIISHPLKSRPTIPAHSQIRSHCANFPVRISP